MELLKENWNSPNFVILCTSSRKSYTFLRLYSSIFAIPMQSIKNQNDNHYSSKSRKWRWGFTLMELIVVITILSILGTLAFFGFTGYQSSARDATRMANVSLISKAMSLSLITDTSIDTSGTSASPNIVLVGSGLTLTGYYGPLNNRFLNSLNIFDTDLTISSDFPYSYSYIPKQRLYQIMGILESSPSASKLNFPTTAYAETNAPDNYVFIRGNFIMTGSIVGIIPSSFDWSNALPDANGVKTISWTGTIQNGATIDPSPPVSSDCLIGTSNIDACYIL